MITMAQTRFAEWLTAMLREKRETPADLARGANIPQSSVSAYLNSGTKPTMETAAKIAAHWELATEDVLREVRETVVTPPSEDVVIPEIRKILAEWTAAEQRRFGLRAIALAEELLLEAREGGSK